jgi:hypothetical protein
MPSGLNGSLPLLVNVPVWKYSIKITVKVPLRNRNSLR